MKQSKLLFKRSNQGFSLIEVLAALLIVSGAVLAALQGQGQLLRSAGSSVRKTAFIVALKNMLTDVQRKGINKDEKALKELGGTVSYVRESIPAASPLHKIPNLKIDRVKAIWQDGGRERTMSVVQFVYVADEQKS